MTQAIQSQTFGAARRPFLAGLVKTWQRHRQARMRNQMLISLRAQANRLTDTNPSYASDLYATADRLEIEASAAASA